MLKNFEDKVAMNKGEKLLPVDETPLFDKSDNPNNEDFVNINDPERKFIPINEVPDLSSEEIEENEDDDLGEVGNAKEEIKRVRHDIGNYNYQEQGSKGKLESFHVNHDEEKIVAVRGGEVVNEPTEPDFIKHAPLEEEFADKNIVTDSKINAHYINDSRKEYQNTYSNASDNLKTMPEAKVQRSNRGIIRKFLDNFSKN